MQLYPTIVNGPVNIVQKYDIFIVTALPPAGMQFFNFSPLIQRQIQFLALV